MSAPLEIVTTSSTETEELGKKLGSLLLPGCMVALKGELGGGKTCFTHGIVAAIAPESSHLVASPTFAIMNLYPGSTPVCHFDFYRLTDAGEIEELGLDEYFDGDFICIAEWPERLGSLLPEDNLFVSFEHLGEDQRRIIITGQGNRAGTILNQLATMLNT